MLQNRKWPPKYRHSVICLRWPTLILKYFNRYHFNFMIDTRELLYAKLRQFSCYIRFHMATNWPILPLFWLTQWAKYNTLLNHCLCYFYLCYVEYIVLNETNHSHTGVIGSDVPWLDCPAYNALTWVITVTEETCMVLLWSIWEMYMQADNLT